MTARGPDPTSAAPGDRSAGIPPQYRLRDLWIIRHGESRANAAFSAGADEPFPAATAMSSSRPQGTSKPPGWGGGWPGWTRSERRSWWCAHRICARNRPGRRWRALPKAPAPYPW